VGPPGELMGALANAEGIVSLRSTAPTDLAVPSLDQSAHLASVAVHRERSEKWNRCVGSLSNTLG